MRQITRKRKTSLRNLIGAFAAMVLFALAAADTLACSKVQSPNVQIHCAGRKVIIGGREIVIAEVAPSDDDRRSDRERALDELAGACDPYTAELTSLLPEQPTKDWLYGEIEWFLQDGTTLIFEPWTPEREVALAAAQQRFSPDNCGYLAFAREGNWSGETAALARLASCLCARGELDLAYCPNAALLLRAAGKIFNVPDDLLLADTFPAFPPQQPSSWCGALSLTVSRLVYLSPRYRYHGGEARRFPRLFRADSIPCRLIARGEFRSIRLRLSV